MDYVGVGFIRFSVLHHSHTPRATLSPNDVCLATLLDEKGVSQLWVIVEPLQEGNQEILEGIIRSILPPIVNDFVLASVDSIPRTGTGKIQRKELKRVLIDGRPGTG